jgi:hypothetical protein
MIKSFTATTRKIDDPQAAVTEILTMLAPDKNLLPNSVGIISCFSEFEDTGALKAICDALPFDCIGTTTCLCSAGQEIDEVLFAITVLTSDDCDFKSLAIPITEQYEQNVNSSLTALIGQSLEKPALFLSYFPLMNTMSGDMILSAIDEATGSIPLFGMTTVDHTADYSSAKTIYNGNGYSEMLVLCAVFGTPKVEYAIASIDDSNIRKQKAIITESNGNTLIGVNGKLAIAYLEEIGYSKEEVCSGLGIVPLVIDYMDGRKPVVRAVFTHTPEGHVVCGGKMPVNATLGIAKHMEKSDVLKTTSVTLRTLVEKGNTILSYSCIARYLVLGMDNTAEAETLIETVGDANYLFSYSGGEICPMPDAKGKLKNIFHNYTIVFCRLS